MEGYELSHEKVWCIRASEFYGHHEFLYERVEYEWREVDVDGRWTGVNFVYEEREDAPPNCVLGCGLEDDDFWCSVEDVWKMIEG